MLAAFKSVVKELPGLRDIVGERDRLLVELEAIKRTISFAPPGHFYSPLPSIDAVRGEEARLFAAAGREIAGVDMREAEQLALLRAFEPFYQEMPFGPDRKDGWRYYFENPAYSYSDAVFLYCMIRSCQPRHIIEVGSGFSSCVTLDTNERYFGNSIETTFVEPYPDLLHSLLKPGDRERARIIPARLQDVPLEEFDGLEANDILFIDSTHVAKIGSDVNYILFEILPRLSQGVYVHFHDIFFPFEYPREWIYEGRAWNECYVLRAFLQYNSSFSIVLMNTFLQHFHRDYFADHMPLCLKNTGGSIWLRKH